MTIKIYAHIKDISDLDDLSDWYKTPLMEFSYLQSKVKLENTTVKNYIYSILRRMENSMNEEDEKITLSMNIMKKRET